MSFNIYSVYKIIFRTIFSLILFISLQVYAVSTGMTLHSGNPLTSSGRNCSECHVTPAQIENIPVISLIGPKVVLVNSKNSYTLTMSGGLKIAAGMNVSAEFGELIPTDLISGLDGSEIVHRFQTDVSLDGTIEWTFDWIAPDTEGTTNIYASVLSTNKSKTSSGDYVRSEIFPLNVYASFPEPIPPVAKIVAPLSAQVNQPVMFDGRNSMVVADSISTYRWDFSDGTTATTAQAEHSFSKTGTNTVYLTVTSLTGKLTHKTFADIEIIDTKTGGQLIPTAKLSGPSTVEAGKLVTFNTSGSTMASYYFDYGDGTPVTASASHTYTSENNYTVSLVVLDGALANVTSMQITITPAQVNPVITGESLYISKCQSCHGVKGIGISGIAKKIQNSNQGIIMNAIYATTTPPAVPDMASIQLTQQEALLISEYLVVIQPITGGSLYVSKCESCHGLKGIGISGIAKNIQNSTATTIMDAIYAVTTPPAVAAMASIQLTQQEATLISTFLVVTQPVNTGQQIYNTNCLSCHGAAGVGGTATVIINASLAMIDNAILTIPSMQLTSLQSLTTAERQQVVNYLVGQTQGDANAGEASYITKCQMCHGTGAGGLAKNILKASIIMIDKAITTIPMMKGIVLNPTEKQDLVAMLYRGPIMKPSTGVSLYLMYCSYCHGVDALGGTNLVAGARLLRTGVTAAQIETAYSGLPNGEPEMSASYLINSGLLMIDLKLIANYLNQ